MKVGQIVFVKKIGNETRGVRPENLITEEVIKKIGNKYFYLKDYCSKFSIEEMRDISGYASSYVVYESMKEIEEGQEYNQKLEFIKKSFSFYGNNSKFTLDKIRKIYDIIKEE